MNDIRRPVALVTGASRGIGRSIAIELASAGFDIAGNARSYDASNRTGGLAEVEEKARAFGAAFEPVPSDVADLDAHEPMFQRILDRFGRIDVLVNNAGVAPLQRMDLLETTPESYDRVMSINARGPLFLAQRIARQMVEQVQRQPDRKPSIIFITSVSAIMSSTNRVEYCMSKAALSQAARVFAHRLAETGINVYDVRPGIVHTDMTAPVTSKYDAQIADGLVPQNRWGEPEDIGRAVAALARGDFAYATGISIEISGGMNIRRL